MKPLRVVFPILSFVLILFFFTASFSTSRAEEEATDARLKKCSSCCMKKNLVCFNLNPDRRLCTAEYEECLKTCTSSGAVSSEWSDCWSSSQDDEK